MLSNATTIAEEVNITMAEPNLVLGWFAAFVGAVGFGSFAVSFFSVTFASLIIQPL